MEKMKHEKSATWKKCNMNKCNMNKCNMEKVQHENSRGVTRSPLTSKMEKFAAVFNGFGNYLSIVNVCGDPRYTSGKSAK